MAQPVRSLALSFTSDELGVSALPGRLGQAVVTYGNTRDILTRATGFIDAYDYTLNPYSGCSFGCTYCYAAFFSRSPVQRDEWGYWVRVKQNAVAVLIKKYPPGRLNGRRIYMSSVTDPYQPIERKVRLTRRLLEILARDHNPKLVVQTRSPDVVRDIVLFRQLIENGGRVQINMTVTTDDEEVRRTFEPYCPSNGRRLEAITRVAESGIETCITMTPLLWLRDADAFATQLLRTGVKRFVVQSFHFGRGRFVANTRADALRLMKAKFNSDSSASFMKTYWSRYSAWRATIADRMRTCPGVTLGEGKEGFAPPF